MSHNPQELDGCPDEATCHHRCIIGCWRVANAEPLSSAGMPGDRWPSSVRREFGNVVQSGAATISGAFDAAVATMDASPGDDADQPPTNLVTDSATATEPGEGTTSVPDLLGHLQQRVDAIRAERRPPPPDPVVVVPAPPLIIPPEAPDLRMVGPTGKGIPVIDLDALLANLDQTVVGMRGWARVLHAHADQAAKWADGLAHLRSTLNGES